MSEVSGVPFPTGVCLAGEVDARVTGLHTPRWRRRRGEEREEARVLADLRTRSLARSVPGMMATARCRGLRFAVRGFVTCVADIVPVCLS